MLIIVTCIFCVAVMLISNFLIERSLDKKVDDDSHTASEQNEH